MMKKNKKSSLLKLTTFIFIAFIFIILFLGVFTAFNTNMQPKNQNNFSIEKVSNDSIIQFEIKNNIIKEVDMRNHNIRIKDAENKIVESIIDIYDNEKNSIQSFDSNKSIVADKNKDILVKPQNSMIQNIYFKNVGIENIDENFIKIDYPNKEDYLEFLEIYAIDPNEFNFTNATVTAIAKGNNLVKCKTWNFTGRKCMPLCEYDSIKNDIICQSGWEKVADVNAGSEYNFLLTPKDPAFATYNSSFGAPYCSSYESPCIANSSKLQCSSDQSSPGPEINQPNTIDSCIDSSSSGSCHNDESVENITITSLNGTRFSSEDTIIVTASWYCYDSSSDYLAIYYTNSTSSINWKNKMSGSTICPNSGFYTKNITFNLDNISGDHAVRAIIKYNSAISDPCPGNSNSYSDQDDVMFNVANTNIAPNINLNLPTNSISFNNIQNINFNFTTQDDFNSILNCSIYLDEILNLTNSSVSNNTLTNFLINGISYGDHNWSIECSDGILKNKSITKTFSITDTISPTWANQEKNKTLINFGDIIKFNTTWSDNVLLSGYIFSTNNSGSWVNSSYTMFSGTTNISENISIINSNVGNTIGWYFWANDSSGNSNKTNIEIFTIGNISTNLLFSVNQSTYPQGESVYEGYIEYIPFQARYLDNSGNSIPGATCVVANDITSDEVILSYNESTGNYTGMVNNYEMHGATIFNVSCSKTNYETNVDSTFAYVIAHGYLWELENFSYGMNSANSHWLRKKPAEDSSPHIYNVNFSATAGNNKIISFPSYGLGKNNSLLRDYSILGNKTLRMNVSINDTSCKPLLRIGIQSYNLTEIKSFFGEAQTISADIPTVIETYITQNFSVEQGNYLGITLYLNCSSAVEEEVNIYYNYSGEPVNLEIPEFVPHEIVGRITAIYKDEINLTIGPNERLNVSSNVNFSLNNTANTDKYAEYFLTLPILSIYPNSLIQNTTYVYNSTGGLMASDNVSSNAAGSVTITSNNIASWYTEIIPAKSTVIEKGSTMLKHLLRDDEMLIRNFSGIIQWNVSVYTISVIEIDNITTWTNYSAYGVNDINYSFNVTKTRLGITEDITNNVSINNFTSKITFPEISTSSNEMLYIITATDISPPEIHLINPSNNTITAQSSQIFNCNISDTSIKNLTLYIWNSSSLIYNKTINLTGINNESNFSYSLINDGNYFWNCLGFDSQENSAWDEKNYTLNYDSTPPNVTINSPLNQTYSNSTQIINISSDGDETWYNWNGTNVSYSTPISIIFNQGPNILIVYSNDSLGNLNTSNIVFKITDTISPTWTNQKKNKTLINSGDIIKFNTTWSDNVLLSGYIFSTNNSGSWVNSSYTTFSGTINISENIYITNSNVGNTIGWYFWANDSYGNSNQTNIQTFTIENISTNLSFSVNQSSYPQGLGLYDEYKVYIPFQVRYLDSLGSPISNATCSVVNDQTSDSVSLTYNESTGNYTGEINNYKMSDLVSFNVTCSKQNYNTSKANITTNVWCYYYLWELDNRSYSSNLTNSHWIKKNPAESSNVYTLTKNILTEIGNNLVFEFPALGLGKNNSLLRDHTTIGNKTLRLNLSINNTSCKPFLELRIKDFDLVDIYSISGEAQLISANAPMVIESIINDNITIQQGSYLYLNLYLNCSSAVEEEISIYYNYSGEPANIEMKNFVSSEIEGKVIAIYKEGINPIIGPNATVNITTNVNFSLNNTGSSSEYAEYFLVLPLLYGNPNSMIPNTVYIYNSTGQLLASDNVSAGAPTIAHVSSDNVVSWYTEIIPANTAIIETGRGATKDLLRDNEIFIENSSGVIKWNITVDTISYVEIENITVWTNYSSYGVNNINYDFNVTKTRRGDTTDITNQIIIDNETKKITFPNVNASAVGVVYLVTASDISSPEIHLISPNNNIVTSQSPVIFTCNITDIAINNLTLYIWNSSDFLIHINTTNLTGTANETNFSYSFSNDDIYYWNCLGFDKRGNFNWSFEKNYSLIFDTTPPSVTIYSPLNQTYDNLTQLLNISSDGIETWYNFNGTNITYIDTKNIIFTRTSNSLTVYSNDSLGNLNTTTILFYINVTGPIINYAGTNSFAIINGSGVNLSLFSLNAENIWAEIVMPNSEIQRINFTNINNTIFNDTSLVGKYSINFYVNDSVGEGESYHDYFEVFPPMTFNLTVVNSNFSGINSTMEIIYRNKVSVLNSSSTGTHTNLIPDTVADLKIKSYSDRFQVILPNLNFSAEDGKIFGMDKLLTPISKYLVSYGINNSYNFTDAIVKIYYDDLFGRYLVENNLKLYKCNNYSFVLKSCIGNWEDITDSSVQNQTDHYFEYTTSSFSGFSIKEYIPPTEGGGSHRSAGVGTPIEETVEYPVVEEIINKSFDVDAKLKDYLINRMDDLILLISYKNFNKIPIDINLVFEIFDYSKNRVYYEKENMTITMDEVQKKIFENLDLSDGKYNLKLKILQDSKIMKEFSKDFEIKSKKIITRDAVGFFYGDSFCIDVLVLLAFLIIIWIILIKIRRKKNIKKSEKKKNIKKSEKKKNIRNRVLAILKEAGLKDKRR